MSSIQSASFRANPRPDLFSLVAAPEELHLAVVGQGGGFPPAAGLWEADAGAPYGGSCTRLGAGAPGGPARLPDRCTYRPASGPTCRSSNGRLLAVGPVGLVRALGVLALQLMLGIEELTQPGGPAIEGLARFGESLFA